MHPTGPLHLELEPVVYKPRQSQFQEGMEGTEGSIASASLASPMGCCTAAYIQLNHDGHGHLDADMRTMQKARRIM